MKSMTNNGEALKVGFIGGGINSAIGETHKIASQMDGQFELVSGFFSRHDDINQQTAVSWGIHEDRVYRDLTGFLQAEASKLDAVVILTPTPTHKDIVIACIEHQLPVICEKSLATSVAEVAEIQRALEKMNGTLLVTFNYSGYPMVRELKQRIADGELGQIRQVMVEMPQEGFLRHVKSGAVPRPQDWRQHDGVIPTVSLDLGAHAHQMVDYIIGEQAQDVYAVHHRFGEIPDVVDTVHCISGYTNQVVCNYWYTKAALGYRNGLRIRVYGSKGSAEWLQMDPEHLKLSNINGVSYVIDRTHPDNLIASQPRYNRFKAGHPAGFIEAFANYYEDIASYLKEGACEYVFGADVAMRGIRYLQAAAASAHKGEKVRITE
ncbi:Glucose-6-phosphate 3-dehydrogenase [Dickeya dianthicola]|uniref:Gfo/Idh/MocA family oxidoreductase n=1 Tax=Dickeya dianthicola TaxID=204039 RepID=A0AAP6VHN1_9GAMM|nr:Gfo/Idh/MocA family oxidoreductase [Dickeya dianthicola]ATO33710.1 Myo-inositol 2-dehydrogenase [Dickeya dianthicola RNS04.9]AYC19581.1 Glucose-6-phosphate 3-dehydrogenase [Dickeya dianthicola]MBI0437685.1 Gfo/Idh/MocA family oxidoreductase [Dickeya dianthicola]MBI0447887.1 Gfo/Idh/MocA family oxidoreductase [Dickeya dianthicola]MBI0452504.1 Gfo/Idh/MocA family oxidoreductase [Dickeya dianthicola]